MSSGPKYPYVTVRMLGEDGNAFSMIGRTMRALKRAGVSQEEVKAFHEKATSGDYDNVIRTIMETVQVK